VNSLLFVEHSPKLHTSGFRWLDVSLADSLAMKDIEESEYGIWRYVRPTRIQKQAATRKA
jgi:hypothetical protein